MKKLVTYILSTVMVAALTIGGTLAYLQDEDSDVNVMTMGNVDIKQHEYERVQNADGTYEMVTSPKYGEGYKLQEFNQGKPLYPATGEITGWGTKVPFDQIKGATGAQAVFAGLNNVQDKFVLVENTGKSDAYVRTIIALEYGSNVKDIIGISTGDFWDWNGVGIVGINGNNYYVYEAVYAGSSSRHTGGVLPAGEYTYNSLGQIYMKNEATNDDVKHIDGNNNGTYDILVLSQAVQTNGFSDAEIALDITFGKVEENVAEWFGDKKIPTLVYNEDELITAIEEEKRIVFGDDIIVNGEYHVQKDAVIDLNGYTLGANGLNLKTENATIKNGKIESVKDTHYMSHLQISSGKVTMENVTVNIDHSLSYQVGGNKSCYEYSGIEVNGAELIINNCDINIVGDRKCTWSFVYGITLANNGSLVANGGKIKVQSTGGTDINEASAIVNNNTSVATLNNVDVDSIKYGSTIKGKLVINTTDSSVGPEDFYYYTNGSVEINHIK